MQIPLARPRGFPDQTKSRRRGFSYGTKRLAVHFLGGWLALAGPALAAPVNIVAFGDSLTAGYLLPAGDAFPVVLEAALKAKGLDVAIANAGVSGDTTTGGVARLDWSVPEGTDLVILELGANDMLRGLAPSVPRGNLETILSRLHDRKIKVLLAGMLATPSLGPAYKKEFDAIYPDLAKSYAVPLYPFFLEGANFAPGTTMPDGLHPTRRGVDAIVARIVPQVAAMVREIAAAR